MQVLRSLKMIFPFLCCFVLFATEAQAEVNNAGVLDSVLDRYLAAAETWGTIITDHASWLFWMLATLSLVWTFGMMALRKADIGEFVTELVRFLMFTGFFWWLLINGPYFASTIIESMQQIGSEAVGLDTTLSPSGIVDVGFEIFWKVLENNSYWKPVDSTIGCLLALAILIILALIGVNMLLLMVSAWILAYGGIFFLGFGGSNWTSDMALNYYKTVLGIATQLFAMVLLVGIGESFLDDYYARMNEGISIKDMSVLLIVALVLLALVNKIPSLISGIITGASVGGGGIGGFGVGAMVGAAGMAMAAASTGGAALMGGLANVAGGAQAVMAAVSKASATMSGGGGGGDSGGSSGGDDSSGGGGGGASGSETSSPLASAMGDSGGGSHSGGSSSTSGASSSAISEGGGGGMKSKMAKAAKFTGEVGKNLAQGIGSVAKGKVDSMMTSGSNRISETAGGKVAAAIKSSGQQPAFNGDSLSGSNNSNNQ